MARYAIRPATEDDLDLLAAWRSRAHVRRWWGDPAVEPESEKLREARVALWIVEYGKSPFAFIQDYAVADWSPHHFDDLPPGARGMDLYIGEPDLLGAGHGPAFVRQHVDRLFALGTPAVGNDHHPAIRAFEKAGFVVSGEALDTRWGRALPMVRFA